MDRSTFSAASVTSCGTAPLRSARLTVAAAKKDGEARVADAKKDASLVLGQAATVSRADRSGTVPQEVTKAALKVDLSKGPNVIGVALPDGGYAAIRVLKSSTHATDPQWKEAATYAYEDAETQAVYDSLKARYKVKYNDERIAKATSQAASAPN